MSIKCLIDGLIDRSDGEYNKRLEVSGTTCLYLFISCTHRYIENQQRRTETTASMAWNTSSYQRNVDYPASILSFISFKFSSACSSNVAYYQE